MKELSHYPACSTTLLCKLYDTVSDVEMLVSNESKVVWVEMQLASERKHSAVNPALLLTNVNSKT